MQTVGELFSIGCHTLTLFSTSARNLQRRLPSVAEHKLTCVCHGDFYQHILSHLLANCDPAKPEPLESDGWLTSFVDCFRVPHSAQRCEAETMLEHRARLRAIFHWCWYRGLVPKKQNHRRESHRWKNYRRAGEAYLALSSDLTHCARRRR